MILKKTLTFAALALGLMLCLGASVFAQQPQGGGRGPGAQQGREGREGREGRRRGGPGFGLRGLRELNLTDAQKEQAHAIFDRYAATIRPLREQLMALREQSRAGNAPANSEEQAKALRERIRESEKAMRAEILGILTPEQRTKLEEMEKERKSRRDEMRKRRDSADPEVQ
ncbi:MAG: Spy/CpxP family protein refolding chaperone [Pyrinomonadaceae bacterium]|nr:Spy/CpxP family protein refolding chaperone [Pyrinomonadaceae bacterium]